MEASHHKPGKGNTVMRMKLKDVRTGSTTDTTMRPDEKVKSAHRYKTGSIFIQPR